MANVHTIGGYRESESDPYSGYRGESFPSSNNNDRRSSQQQMLFVGGDSSNNGGASPYPALNKVLAPDFNKQTFIFWISVVQVVMFIIELIVGQVEFSGAFVSENSMAGPSAECLRAMGAKYLPDIQKGEIYRFVAPALLHAGVLHIFTNLVSQTMIGYTMEKQWGIRRMASFYFATAFGATLLSCVGNPCSISVGASGALLGIIGCHMAWLLLNWNNRDLIPQPCSRMCSMVWWLFIIFMIGISVRGIDNLAHLGGWLSGMLVGISFNNATNPISWMENKKAWKIIGIFLTIIYFTSTLASTFFGVRCKRV